MKKKDTYVGRGGENSPYGAVVGVRVGEDGGWGLEVELEESSGVYSEDGESGEASDEHTWEQPCENKFQRRSLGVDRRLDSWSNGRRGDVRDVIVRVRDRQHTRRMANVAGDGKMSRVAWWGDAGRDNRPRWEGWIGPVCALSRRLWAWW